MKNIFKISIAYLICMFVTCIALRLIIMSAGFDISIVREREACKECQSCTQLNR